MLRISKTVTGDLGDLTKPFDFTLTVTQPAGVTGSSYKAYVVVAADEPVEEGHEFDVVTTSANCPATTFVANAGKGYCLLPSSTTPYTGIKLSHGQSLVFTDLHNGATYTAVESADANYKAEVSIIANDLPYTISNPNANTALSTNQRTIGEGENTADFTNDRVQTTPTGLRLNDLPFVGLIVLGLAALVLVAVTRRGKSHA